MPEQRTVTSRGLVLGAALLTLTVVGALVLLSGRGWTGSDEVSHAHAMSQERTVLVSSERMPAPSVPGSVLHALRISGVVPGSMTRATVLSDRDCAPDARGVSRCVNAMRLSTGRVLAVRHPHRMMNVPCLEPGERVRVSRV